MLTLIPQYQPKKDNKGKMIPKAEVSFFETIKKQKDQLNEWMVFWNIHIDEHLSKQDGQVDFIFLGKKGLFVVEAKGGDSYVVKGNKHYYFYKSQGMNSDYAQNESALTQAEGNMRSIENYIRNKIPTTKVNIKKRVIGFGAVLPFIDTTNIDSGIQFNSGQIYGSQSTSISDFLDFLIKHSKAKLQGEREQFSDSELNVIRNHLQIEMKCVSKFYLSQSEHNEIMMLESNQQTLASYFLSKSHSRFLIEGGAGTGKTVLAKYFAHSLINDNKKVLWISFNKLFTEHIKEYFGDIGKIEIISATKFKMNIIKQNTGQIVTTGVEDNDFDKKFLEAASMDKDSLDYDFIIMDEAQDILSGDFFWGMDELIKGGFDESSWAIFLDSESQAHVFNRLDRDALQHCKQKSDFEESLIENYRNPRKIVKNLYEYLGKEPPEAKREFEGEIIEKKVQESLEKTLLNIVKKEDKPVVLSTVAEIKFFGDKFDNKKFFELSNEKYFLQSLGNEKISQTVLRNYDTRKAKPIEATNIHTFKGLESEVIILVIDKEELEEKREEFSYRYYTGLSRTLGKAYLVLT